MHNKLYGVGTSGDDRGEVDEDEDDDDTDDETDPRRCRVVLGEDSGLNRALLQGFLRMITGSDSRRLAFYKIY